MDKLAVWNALKQPPKEALRQIQGGRLRGKTDINPQWRYKAMTEQFGPCGLGWKYEIVKQWTEPAPQGQVFAFVDILLYVKDSDKWADPIPGTGGAMLVELESGGLHASDEAFKMATTDALGVAMKMLGVAADIYAGLWDGAKYLGQPENKPPEQKAMPKDITPEQFSKGLMNLGYDQERIDNALSWAAGKAYRLDDALQRIVKAEEKKKHEPQD